MLLRKFFTYLLFLIPWFLSGILFSIDTGYYKQLNLPFFAPPPIIFGIVWPILYVLIAYAIYKTFSLSNTNYKIYLVINYLANQLFTFCFFVLKNNFLSLVDTIIILISSMYLYVETKILNEKVSWYWIPYMIWNVFAFILIFSVFVMN